MKPSLVSFLCSSRGRSGLGGRLLGWFKLEWFWAHSSKLMPPSKLGQICYGHLQCPPMLFKGCLTLQPHSSAPGPWTQRVGSASANHLGDLVALNNPVKMGIHGTFLFKWLCMKWNGNRIQETWFSSVVEGRGCFCLFLCGKCFVKESHSSCCRSGKLPAAEGPRDTTECLFQAQTRRFISSFLFLTLWILFSQFCL